MILHGYGMLARGILHWFRSAERNDRLLIAPEALSRFYTELSDGKRAVGASWTTREELESEIEDQFQYIDQVVSQLVPAEIPLHVHGFSQGVSAGTRWCTRTRRSVSRLVCWAGAVPDDVTGERLKLKLGAMPIDLVVGDRDIRVPPEKVEADAARLRAGGLEVAVHRFAGGHVVDRGTLTSLEG